MWWGASLMQLCDAVCGWVQAQTLETQLEAEAAQRRRLQQMSSALEKEVRRAEPFAGWVTAALLLPPWPVPLVGWFDAHAGARLLACLLRRFAALLLQCRT